MSSDKILEQLKLFVIDHGLPKTDRALFGTLGPYCGNTDRIQPLEHPDDISHSMTSFIGLKRRSLQVSSTHQAYPFSDQGGEMKVEVLGPGCKRCDQLHENTLAAVSLIDSPTAIHVEKIADINYFTKMGVFVTPGLVIEGEVVSVGKVLSTDEIKLKIEEKIR